MIPSSRLEYLVGYLSELHFIIKQGFILSCITLVLYLSLKINGTKHYGLRLFITLYNFRSIKDTRVNEFIKTHFVRNDRNKMYGVFISLCNVIKTIFKSSIKSENFQHSLLIGVGTFQTVNVAKNKMKIQRNFQYVSHCVILSQDQKFILSVGVSWVLFFFFDVVHEFY